MCMREIGGWEGLRNDKIGMDSDSCGSVNIDGFVDMDSGDDDREKGGRPAEAQVYALQDEHM